MLLYLAQFTLNSVPFLQKFMRHSLAFLPTSKITFPVRSLSALGLVLLTLPLVSCGRGKDAAAAPVVVPVQLKVLESTTVANSSEFVGTLEAAAKVELKPEIQGRIATILVQPGDRIEKGAPILTLQPDQTLPQLESAQASVNAARANQRSATEQLQVAQKNLQVARTELSSAQASRNLAQTNFNRATFLLNQGALGRLDYDRAKTDLDIKSNQVKAAQERVQSAEAVVNQARAGVAQATAGIQQAQAQVNTAAVSLGYKQVLAPIAGVVGDVPVQVGDYVSVGQTTTTIVQNDAVDLRFSVPSNRLNDLRTGLPVELIDPTTRNRLSTGQVNFISPTVDSTAQAVLVKARFPNSSGVLRNGQYVEARLIWDEGTGVLIPTNAVLQVSGKSFAYVAEADPAQGEGQLVARMRPVTLGDIQDQSYQVIDGLQAGENVVVSGILRLKDGVPIQPES